MKKTVISLVLLTILFSGCSFDRKNSTTVKSYNHNIPYKAKILLDKAVNEIRYGETSTAISDLKDLTTSYPGLAIGYYNLGLAYINNKQTNEAIKAWEETIKIDNKYSDAYFNLGKAYKSINKTKARYNLIKYITLRPDDPYIRTIKDEISKLSEPVVGKGVIGSVSTTDEVDFKNNIALSVKDFFKPETPAIYSCIELINTSKDKDIQVNWFYILPDNEKLPVNSVHFSEQGSKNVIVSLKKPYKIWPAGIYEEVILVNGVENVKTSFIIQR